jgi:hypothetical protein
MQKFIVAGVVAALFASTPALAKEMHCHMNKDYKAAFDGKEFKSSGTTYKLKVKDTFKGIPESVSTKDYNKYVNVKWGTEKTTSKTINLQVRPRQSSECLNGIYNDDKKQVWGGAYCDTSNHQQGKGFNLHAAEGTNGTIYSSGGAATTTTKQNQFLGFYAKDGSNYILIGGCVEDK